MTDVEIEVVDAELVTDTEATLVAELRALRARIQRAERALVLDVLHDDAYAAVEYLDEYVPDDECERLAALPAPVRVEFPYEAEPGA